MGEEDLTIIKTENTTKNNIPQNIILHNNKDFPDIFSKAVVDLINIMLNPV